MNDDIETSEENDLFSEVQDIKDSLKHLNDKIARLERYQIAEDRIQLAQKTLDKFDDYMKNLHKMNEMLNEMKGQVALVRAAMNKTEKYQRTIHEKYKKAMKSLALGIRDTDGE